MRLSADPGALALDEEDAPIGLSYARVPFARRCPIRAAQDARHLLRTGRGAIAETILAGLPGLVQVALAAAAQAARRTALERLREVQAELAAVRIHEAALRREVASLRLRRAGSHGVTPRPPRPAPRRCAPKPTPTEAARLNWLRETCATALGRQLVQSMLRIQAGDLEALLQGKAGLSTSTWRRLMTAAGTED